MQTTKTRKREALDYEALLRGSRLLPNSNDAQCILAFAARGIPESDIVTLEPGQNVRTYRAWRAKGRQVRKGEKSVHLTVWRPIDSADDDDDSRDKRKGRRSRPITACVFHISQTDPIGGAS